MHPIWSLLRLPVSVLLLLLLPVPAAVMPTPTPTPALLYFFVFHVAAPPSDALVVRIPELERPAGLVPPQVRHGRHECGPGDFRVPSHVGLPPSVVRGGGVGQRGRRGRAEEVRVVVVVRVVGMMRVVWVTGMELEAMETPRMGVRVRVGVGVRLGVCSPRRAHV